jgi:hypothetical protein
MIRTPNATIASASGTSRAALGGRSFWAVSRAAIPAIQPTLIAPSTTSIAISPALEPTQHSPNPKPRPGGLAAAAAETPLERRELVSPGGDRHRASRRGPVRPVQRVPHNSDERPGRQVGPGEQRHRPHATGTRARVAAGAAPGSIIAAIIATHTAAKNANEPSRVATPMSIPVICQTETIQHAAASPSVAVSAAAAVVLTAVMARCRGRQNGRLPGAATGRWGARPATLTLAARRAGRRQCA